MRFYELVESVDRDAMEALLAKYFSINGNYVINANGTISVEGDVTLRSRIKGNKLPVIFSTVSGSFDIENKNLTTLEGTPRSVGTTFNCGGNVLATKNLIGGPVEAGRYEAWRCGLESLEGSPRVINGDFHCFGNSLKSLAGAPQRVGGDFTCSDQSLESIDGLPDGVQQFRVDPTRSLPMLKALKCKLVYSMSVTGDYRLLMKIINKYCGDNYSRKSILACQKELIDAGFEGNASW